MNIKNRVAVKIALSVFFALFFSPAFAFFSVSSFVTKEIVTFIEKSTGSKVDVESVDVSIFRGKVEINSMRLSNPKEYSQSNAFNVGKVVVDIDILTIFNKEIVIDDIIIKNATMFYEPSRNGYNFQKIQDNIANYILNPKNIDHESKFIVKHVAIYNGTIVLPSDCCKKPVMISAPNMEFTNLGEGKRATEVFKHVYELMLENIRPSIEGNKVALNSLKKEDETKI